MFCVGNLLFKERSVACDHINRIKCFNRMQNSTRESAEIIDEINKVGKHS